MSDNLIKSLEIMGIGMLGIFMFMFIFYLVIVGLDKFFPNKDS